MEVIQIQVFLLPFVPSSVRNKFQLLLQQTVSCQNIMLNFTSKTVYNRIFFSLLETSYFMWRKTYWIMLYALAGKKLTYNIIGPSKAIYNTWQITPRW